MAVSYPTIKLASADWVDIITASLSGKTLLIQNADRNFNWVFFGGTTPPGVNDGIKLDETDAIQGASDHIWVKGGGLIAVMEV